MSKRRKKSHRKKSSQCPEPINTMIDLAGAAAMGLYVNHKVKQDFKKGCGEESAKAAATVCGIGAMRRGGDGMVGLGGLIGLNSALSSIEKQQAAQSTATYVCDTTPYVSPIAPPTPAIKHPVKTGVWREHCEDGSIYGVNPEDYETADDYEYALKEAKKKSETADDLSESGDDLEQSVEMDKSAPDLQPRTFGDDGKYRWRKYCEDGSQYRIRPEDFETADDYADALSAAKNGK